MGKALDGIERGKGVEKTQLHSDRLILRRFVPDDALDLYEYLRQEAAVRFEPYGVKTLEECQKEAIRRSEMEEFWAVCLKEGQKLIGNLYFERQQPECFRTWEIGYVFNPLYWGEGYATESSNCLLQYAFLKLDAHRVTAFCDPENTASWRLLERLGMRREGHMKKNVFFHRDVHGNPIWKDTYGYAILLDEWHNSNRTV